MNRISTSALLLGSLLSFASSSAAQAPNGPMTPAAGTVPQPPPPQTQLKVQVTLVNLPVTVRNAHGEMIHDLNAADFKISDNGVAQKITHFDLGGDPVSVVILVETSSRIVPYFPQLRKSGILLTQMVMGLTGEAALVTFNDDIDKLQDFTTSPDAIENGFASLAPGTSGSKLYDAMNLGIEMLTHRPDPRDGSAGRRRVLLVLSEATDIGSSSKLGAVLRRAQLQNVAIYAVGLSTTKAELLAPSEKKRIAITPPGTFPLPPQPGTPQTPNSEEQREGNIDLMALAVWAVQHVENQVDAHALEMAALATGGKHVSIFKDRSIENAIDDVGAELHSQYTLTYAPTGSDQVGYHEIQVRVDKKDLAVRARPGYYISGVAN